MFESTQIRSHLGFHIFTFTQKQLICNSFFPQLQQQQQQQQQRTLSWMEKIQYFTFVSLCPSE
jgi:hypothetical protein